MSLFFLSQTLCAAHTERNSEEEVKNMGYDYSQRSNTYTILISPLFGIGSTFSIVSLHSQALPAIQGENKELERGKEGGHIVIAERGGRGRPIKRQQKRMRLLKYLLWYKKVQVIQVKGKTVSQRHSMIWQHRTFSD